MRIKSSSNAKYLSLFSTLLIVATLSAGTTTVLFQPSSPTVGPFPNDALTVSDPAQRTGLRVNLPYPSSCGSPALSACENTALLNQLDGFSVNPRIAVCFSDAIDPNNLNSAIQFMAADGSGTPIKVNQTIYDPIGKCAYAKPDRVLAQHTRYLLLVSAPLNDADGHKVKPDKAFTRCLKDKDSSTYCAALSSAMGQLGQQDGKNLDSLDLDSGKLLAASLFTTMSATDWLEKARRVADAGPAFVLPAGSINSFNLNTVKSLTYVPQDNIGKNTVDIPISVLAGVETIAFGLYFSPNFLNVSGPIPGSITVSPTNGPISGPVPIPGLDPSIPPGFLPISFHVFLPPASQEPAGGFPVVIYGHGFGDTQFGAPSYIASTLAQQGFAAVTIEIPGHGFGLGSHVIVTEQNGRQNVVATPGRGLPFSAGGTYGPSDGCVLPGPLAVRDCGRQTAVDLSAMVHTIQGTQGLGLNLNPSQIFYVGQSFGGTYGTLFHAVEPAVSRAVLNVAGGTSVDISRLAIGARPLGVLYLGTNNPPLLNVPPPISAPPQAYFHDAFNDNYVLRDVPVVVNNIPGALPIQAAFEVADWLGMLGDPLAFAPHLKRSPLAGVPAKETLFQFGYGDLEVPNPTESALVRAADGLDTTWFFRFDRAVQTSPELLGITLPGSSFPSLPHKYLSNPTIFSFTAEKSFSLATQMQVAKFFQGQANPDPNPFLTAPYSGVKLFEKPVVLPEKLNFLQLQP